VARLETEVSLLKNRAVAQDAVDALLRRLDDQRRWLIGLSFSSGLSICGLVVALNLRTGVRRIVVRHRRHDLLAPQIESGGTFYAYGTTVARVATRIH